MDIHDKHIYVEEFLRCNECSHKSVCMIRQKLAGEKVVVPTLEYDDDCPISVHVNCKYFRKMQNPFQPKPMDYANGGTGISRDFDHIQVGTGIEYLYNQPICTSVVSDQNGNVISRSDGIIKKDDTIEVTTGMDETRKFESDPDFSEKKDDKCCATCKYSDSGWNICSICASRSNIMYKNWEPKEE